MFESGRNLANLTLKSHFRLFFLQKLFCMLQFVSILHLLNLEHMEIINDTPAEPKNRLSFDADGWELLGILILNNILTFITLSIYYPWARVARLRFIYQSAHLNDTPFVFHGTGRELIKGYIKFLGFFIIIFCALIYGTASGNMVLYAVTFIFYFVALMLIIPLAIHGALRYRLSRTSWRGIHFGYRGDRKQLILDFIIGYLGVLFSLGIYSAWWINTLRTYIISNIRFGSLRFGYDGKGGELFVINLKGFFFSILTLGIYYFWYKKNWMNYFADHSYIEQNGNRYYLMGDFDGADFLWLVLGNVLLTLFTFGFGIPWVIIRTVRFVLSNLEIPQEVDFDAIAQTEDDYADATGDDVLDFLDLGII